MLFYAKNLNYRSEALRSSKFHLIFIKNKFLLAIIMRKECENYQTSDIFFIKIVLYTKLMRKKFTL